MDPTPTTRYEHRFEEIVADYLEAQEAGRAEDLETLLARHPTLANEIAGFFAHQEELACLAEPLRQMAAAPTVSCKGGSPGETTDSITSRLEPMTALRSFRDYELLEEIARGGMGVVFKARQVSANRLVALKMILSGQLASDDERQRFRLEAEAAANLDHPNIVPIYEVGEHDGQHYFSMKLLEGGSLAQRAGSHEWRCKLAIKGIANKGAERTQRAASKEHQREAAQLLVTVARAVDHAHQRGILHRDLKPANILLDVQGQPHVTDFGLARRVEGGSGQTQSGAVVGTPSYMPPEQASGQKGITTAADIYSLGAVLYELLTGRPPFRAETTFDTLLLVMQREPERPRALNPRLSHDLETVCLKCLDKDPRKRYPTAEAMAQDLERCLAGEPILGRRSPAWARAYRWVRRNSVVSVLTGLMLLVFLGGFAAVAWQWRETHAALERAEANLSFQRISLADREIQAGNTDGADVLLDLCPPALRHWEWHYLKRRCHGNWLRLAGHTDLVRCVTYNADGTRLASCGNDGTVRVWDMTTNRELLTLRGHTGWVHSVVFHGDGQRLVSASEDGTVKVWEGADGRELHNLPCDVGDVNLSPDGRLFALLRSEELTVHDLETGRAKTTIPGRHPHHGKAIAFCPDGRSLAATLDAGIRIWDVQTGQEIHVLQQSLPNGGIYCMTFSPDGHRLFASQHEDKYPALKVWDTTTGQEIPGSLSTPLTVSVMALSPDGRSIATGGHEGAVKVRDTATGKDFRAIRTFDDAIGSLAFRPDGQGLAVTAGRDVWLRSWGERKDQGPTILRDHTGGVTSVAFSPDGSRLSSCGEIDRVKIWDGRTGQAVLHLSAAAKGYSGVVFSPDGRRLLATGGDGTVYTWDAVSGQPGPSLRVQSSKLTEAAFSPDGLRIATAGSDRAVRVWDAATGQVVLTCNGHEAGVWGVRFSPDGGRLGSAGGDETVRVWDAATGREILTLRGHVSYVQSVAFHPSGRLLASASTDETVRLWDIASGREVAKLQGHTGPVGGLSFNPDGHRLASASEDGTVRLWDVTTGQEALSLPDPGNGKVRWVAFSPDGWRLAMASSDGTVKIWDAAPLEN